MKEYEVSARTIEEAVSQGLEHLGVSISDVKVDVIEEGSKGLFGLFGSRPAKVRLTLMEDDQPVENVAHSILADVLKDEEPKQQPRKQERAEKTAEKTEKAEKTESAEKTEKTEKPVKAARSAKAKKEAAEGEEAEKPAPKPRKPREPKAAKAPKAPKEAKEPAEPKEIVPAEQADRETAAGRAQEFLQELTQFMGVNVSVAVATDEEGNVRVNRGQSNYTRVTLDTEGYRAKREEALVRLANRMANRAQKTGRKVSLEPMNPYERRILHSALQDHPAVTTHSEGEEPNRHVVISLKN